MDIEAPISVVNYCHLQFHLQLIDSFRTHEFNGSMIRGTLMREVRNLVCTTGQNDCSDCPFINECVYHRIFEPTVVEPTREQNAPRFHISQIPRPFVLDTSSMDNQRLQSREFMNFDLILFGNALEALPFFVFGIHKMGDRGLGRERARFRLREVRDHLSTSALIYSDMDKQLTDPHTVPLFTVNDDAPPVRMVHLRIGSPFFTKTGGHPVRHPDFYHFIRVGVTRLEMLSHFYGSGDLPFPAGELIRMSQDVEEVSARYRWVAQSRFSSRQKKELKIGGVMGDVLFKGDLRPFMPVLRALEISHLGKNASFGLGKIIVDEIE